MKKTIFAILAAAALGLVSCQKPLSPAEEVAGDYSGNMTISVLGQESSIEQTISVTASGENTIDLSINSFTAMGMELGTITLPGCNVAKDGDMVTVTSEQTLSLETVGDCAISLDGSFKNNQAALDLSIKPSILPVVVAVHFEGTRAE